MSATLFYSAVFGHIFAYFLEEASGEYKVVESFVGCIVYLAHIANPFAMTLVDEDNILADTENAVHIVGVDYGCEAVLMGDVAQEFVDEDTGLRVESAVWLVAE